MKITSIELTDDRDGTVKVAVSNKDSKEINV